MENVNGEYRFVGENRPGFTINKVYNFKNGYTYDDDGDIRPYISMNWMKVEEVKHNLVNGWYKCVNGYGDSCFTPGKQYYFKNGVTIDDSGHKRPCGGHTPQKYNDLASDLWFKDLRLVPADSEQDAFDRVMKAAIACSDEMGGCHKLECPYAGFGADSNECHEMIKEDCKKAAFNRAMNAVVACGDEDNKLEWPRPGATIRDKSTLIVYWVESISRKFRHPKIADITLVSFMNRYRATKVNVRIDQFWDQYEAFEPARDGYNGTIVSTCNYKDAFGNTVMESGKLYDVINGQINPSSMLFIKDPSELMKKNGKQVIFEVKGECEYTPSKGFDYTGRALCKLGSSTHNLRSGYIYTFKHGTTANDRGGAIEFSRSHFEDYFIPLD